MPMTQQQQIFSTLEAERFAALWAGFDAGNHNEAEAMGKGRAVRRMAVEKEIRLIDALELPEIRQAIDVQMQPLRQAVPDVAALQAENDELQRKIGIAVPKVTELAQNLEAVAKERKSETLYGLAVFGSAGIIFWLKERN